MKHQWKRQSSFAEKLPFIFFSSFLLSPTETAATPSTVLLFGFYKRPKVARPLDERTNRQKAIALAMTSMNQHNRNHAVKNKKNIGFCLLFYMICPNSPRTSSLYMPNMTIQFTNTRAIAVAAVKVSVVHIDCVPKCCTNNLSSPWPLAVEAWTCRIELPVG